MRGAKKRGWSPLFVAFDAEDVMVERVVLVDIVMMVGNRWWEIDHGE